LKTNKQSVSYVEANRAIFEKLENVFQSNTSLMENLKTSTGQRDSNKSKSDAQNKKKNVSIPTLKFENLEQLLDENIMKSILDSNLQIPFLKFDAKQNEIIFKYDTKQQHLFKKLSGLRPVTAIIWTLDYAYKHIHEVNNFDEDVLNQLVRQLQDQYNVSPQE